MYVIIIIVITVIIIISVFFACGSTQIVQSEMDLCSCTIKFVQREMLIFCVSCTAAPNVTLSVRRKENGSRLCSFKYIL